MRLLLTGVPGVGKTTLLRSVAERVSRASGFTTREIREGGRRVGFEIRPLGGERRIMAHVDFSGPRVGRYGVDVAAMDEVAEATLGGDANLYLIDEIGKMECFSRRFVELTRDLFHSERSVVATVALRGGGFIAEVKRAPGVEIWEVTRSNRDALVERVVQRIGPT